MHAWRTHATMAYPFSSLRWIFVVVLFHRFSLRIENSRRRHNHRVSHVSELFVPSSVRASESGYYVGRCIVWYYLSHLQQSNVSHWIEWPKPSHIASHFRMNISYCLWLDENVMEMEYWPDLSRRLAIAGWLAVPLRHQKSEHVCVRRWNRLGDANEINSKSYQISLDCSLTMSANDKFTKSQYQLTKLGFMFCCFFPCIEYFFVCYVGWWDKRI